MSRAKKLQPVAEMVHKAAEQELIKLGEVNAVLQQNQAQLDDLIQYRHDYLAQFRREGMTTTAKKALDMRAFLIQLDQAIKAQQQQVEQSQQFVTRQQYVWREARNKERAIETLIDKYEAEEDLRQFKREQKEMDEHTTAMWVRKKHE